MNYLKELNELNKQFCRNAEHFSYQIRAVMPNKETGKPEETTYWKAKQDEPEDIGRDVAVYRSIVNADGKSLLFVIDLDYHGDRYLEERIYETAEYMTQIFPKQFFVKYSGNRGFHLFALVDKTKKSWKDHASERQPWKKSAIPKEQQLQEYFKYVAHGITKHVPGTTVNQDLAKKKDLVWLDTNMYHVNKVIRGLCVNFKTSLFSVPVDFSEDTMDDILARARLEAPMGFKKIKIPEFNLFDLADPDDDVKKRIPRKIDEKRFKKYSRYAPKQAKTGPEGYPPCIKKILTLEEGFHPAHHEMVFLASWLNQHQYAKEEIMEIVREVMGEKYDPRVTEAQVDFIVGKDYRYAGCRKVREEYGLCSPDCPQYRKGRK